MNSDAPMKRDRGPVIGGVVFIVVGLVLLLEKMGILPSGFGLHFWPCIFIVIGLVKIVYAGGRPTGTAIIAVGIFLQLHEIGVIHLNFWDLWPVFIIIAGAAMLWQAIAGPESATSTDPEFESLYVFGGGDRYVDSKNFKGGSLFAVFGGYKIDLTHAEMEGDRAVINASAVFGGGQIRVPENWQVSAQGAGSCGQSALDRGSQISCIRIGQFFNVCRA